jgi:hypothetical protein
MLFDLGRIALSAISALAGRCSGAATECVATVLDDRRPAG